MSTSEPSNSVASVDPWVLLSAYLLSLFPKADIFRYSCNRCFEFLWSQLDRTSNHPECNCLSREARKIAEGFPPSAALSDSRRTIILYDGAPGDYARPKDLPNIHFDAVFSPVSLFVLTRRLPPAGEGGWVVVDPHGRLDSGSQALARILSPHVLIIRGEEAPLLKALQPNPELSSADLSQDGAALEYLSFMLTSPGRRHAVSNLIGPVLLGFTPKQGKAGKVVNLLKHILQLVGVLKEEELGEGAGDDFSTSQEVLSPGEFDRLKTPPQTGWAGISVIEPTEFVLIDDQVVNGWGDVLCRALGTSFLGIGEGGPTKIGESVNEKVVISASNSAEYLLKRLEDLPSKKTDNRFKFEVGMTGFKQQILLLDLRLFEGKPLEEEKLFLSRLLKIAFARVKESKSAFSAGFKVEELERIDRWVRSAHTSEDGARGETTYLEALSLFPRILSSIDFSLPIIIFSSTGQREVTDRFRLNGNIITDFEKPKLFGYQSSGLLLRTQQAFITAVRKALVICKARELCAGLITAAEAHPPITRGNWGNAAHFELYIDESGSSYRSGDPGTSDKKEQNFVIAGLLLAYENASNPGYTALHDWMSKKGLRWWPETNKSKYIIKQGPRDENIDLPGGEEMRDVTVINNFLYDIRNNKKLAVPKAIAVCIRLGEDNSSGTDFFRQLQRSDNRYRQMLSALLEMVIYDLLPFIVSKKPASLSIFVATRVRHYTEFQPGRGKGIIQKYRDRFGYQGNQSYAWMQSIDESAISHIVFEVLSKRDDAPVIEIEHARGVTLAYPQYETDPQHQRGTQFMEGATVKITLREDKPGKYRIFPVIYQRQPKWAGTRHQHYLADLVAKACFRQNERYAPWNTLFEEGLIDTFNPNLESLLRAARLVSAGDHASAILEMKNYKTPKKLEAGSGAIIILHRIAEMINRHLSSSEFGALSDKLENEEFISSQIAPSATTIERGEIVYMNEYFGYGFISSPGRSDCRFELRNWISTVLPSRGVEVEYQRYTSESKNARWVRASI
jgi:hypothetical protein